MDIPHDETETLLGIIKTDPDFVDQYLGDNNPSFTVAQCAKALGLCNNTILYRIKTGTLKAERDVDGFWFVKAKDLQDHVRKGGGQKGFSVVEKPKKTETKEESPMKSGCKYDKSSSQNVLDFLHHWEKSNTIGFSTKTLCDDFNKVCATRTTEGQMSGILSTLTKKGILVRRGRGIYSLAEGFKPQNEVAAPVIHAVPVVQAEIEDEESDEEERTYEELKTEERHLIDKYLLKFADPTEDFVFTIGDVADHYPGSDRKKIGKALNNMYANEKLLKGRATGEYIKKATAKKVQPQGRGEIASKFEEILRLNISDDLKAKIIKEMMN